jgi:hypothetical protein
LTCTSPQAAVATIVAAVNVLPRLDRGVASTSRVAAEPEEAFRLNPNQPLLFD